MTPPYLRDMGLRLLAVWPLEGAKLFPSRSIISATAAGIAAVLSLQCATFGALYSAPIHWGTDAPFGGHVPNRKFTFLERNIFCAPAEVCGFTRNTQRGCSRGCEIFMEI